MQEIIVDEGKIKCLISGKFRKETPKNIYDSNSVASFLIYISIPNHTLKLSILLKSVLLIKDAVLSSFMMKKNLNLWIINTKNMKN